MRRNKTRPGLYCQSLPEKYVAGNKKLEADLSIRSLAISTITEREKKINGM